MAVLLAKEWLFLVLRELTEGTLVLSCLKTLSCAGRARRSMSRTMSVTDLAFSRPAAPLCLSG